MEAKNNSCIVLFCINNLFIISLCEYCKEESFNASWVQNVVRQFGPYLSWAQDI